MWCARTRALSGLAVAALAAAGPTSAGAAPTPPAGTLDLFDGADVAFAASAPGALSGRAVASLGDVNGDGVPDMAVGSPTASPLARSNAGIVHVVFGTREPAPVSLGNLGSGGFDIQGGGTEHRTGSVIAGAGDLNGDGLADILIGNPRLRFTGGTGQGFVYAVFGKADAGPVDLKSPGAGAFRISGADGDRAGSAVGAVGDFDGDGRPEVLVGAPSASPGGRPGAGRVLIVLSAGRTGNVNLASPGTGVVEIDGAAAGDAVGSAVAGLPDVNGDGRPDVAVGAPRAFADPTAGPAGAAYLVYSPPPPAGAAVPPVDLAALDPQRGAALFGSAGDMAGTALASVGDLGGDGVADLAVGAPYASPFGRSHAGAVYVVDGRVSGPAALATLPAPIAGAYRFDHLGLALDGGAPPGAAFAPPAVAIAIGAPESTNVRPPTGAAQPLGRLGAGAAYVIFPGVAGTSIDLALPPAGAVERLVGPVAGEHLGGSVAVIPRPGRTDTAGVLVGHLSDPADAPAAAWAVSPVGAPARPSSPVAGPVSSGCVPARDVEAIVDDSGSMRDTDPEVLRLQALDLLISKPSNKGRVVGAVEFGSAAQQIFPPLALPDATDQLHATLEGLLAEHIRHDDDQTNYTAAFAAAGAQNPEVQGRIFLTDGGHNVGPFDLSVTAGPPTYVIGLGNLLGATINRNLQAIADSTGGQYFRHVSAKQLAPVLDAIDSIGLGCASGLATAAAAVASTKGAAPARPDASDAPTIDAGVAGALPAAAAATDRRPVVKFTTDLPPTLPSADLTLTWDSTSDRFAITSVTLVDGGRKVRVHRRRLARALSGKTIRAGRLTIVGTRGKSFQTLHVSGLAQAAGSALGRAATRRHFINWSTRRRRGHGRAAVHGAAYRPSR
jgi:hypothetical protein